MLKKAENMKYETMFLKGNKQQQIVDEEETKQVEGGPDQTDEQIL